MSVANAPGLATVIKVKRSVLTGGPCMIDEAKKHYSWALCPLRCCPPLIKPCRSSQCICVSLQTPSLQPALATEQCADWSQGIPPYMAASPAWQPPQHTSQRPEGHSPCRKTCSKLKLLGIGKRRAKSRRIQMDLTLTTGTSLGKKGKLGCTWWKLINNSSSPFKGAWEQVTLTRKKWASWGTPFA